LEQAAERSGKRKSRRWFSVLSVLLAIVLVTLAFRGVNWNELLSTAAGARLDYFFVCVVLVCLTTSLRGMRWWVLLRADGPISMGTVIWASVAGQFTNSYIPGRGGDVFRVIYLGKRADASKSFALATTLTERVSDVVALALFGIVAIMWLEEVPSWLIAATRVMVVLGILGVLGIFAIPLLESQIHSVVKWVPLPSSLTERLTALIPRFVEGLKALHQPARALFFILLTIITLLIDALVSSLWAIALHLSLPFKCAVVLNTVLNLSQAIPITPAGLGAYQFLAVTLLVPFGFSQSQALGYIISSQVMAYIVMAVLGCVALIRPQTKMSS
jgi:uncharacterized protein (TIRG00374 family)